MSKTAPSKKARQPRRARSAATQTSKVPPQHAVTFEYLKAILLAVALALVIRTFFIQAFRIPSGSMEDTLLVGDFLLANKFIYGAQMPFTSARLPALRDPQSGDIVIFQYPEDPSRDFIKRIVAIPGQTVEIRDKVLYVDGKRTVDPPRSKYVDPHIIDRNRSGGIRDHFGPEKVPPGHYFVMGDNRDNSDDSRYWGFLNRELIRGNAFMLYWSWSPDAHAPHYQNLSSIPSVLFYNLLHLPQRTRWSRIGMLVK